MREKILKYTNDQNIILDDDYYSITELLTRKPNIFKYQLEDINNFIEIFSNYLFYENEGICIDNEFLDDFLEEDDLEYFLKDLVEYKYEFDIIKTLNEIYFEIKNNKMSVSKFLNSYYFILLILDFEKIIENLKKYDVIFADKLLVILDFIFEISNAIKIDEDNFIVDFFDIWIDDQYYSNYEKKDIQYLFVKKNILNLIGLILEKQYLSDFTLCIKFINQYNYEYFLNNIRFFKNNEEKTIYINKIQNFSKILNVENLNNFDLICNLYEYNYRIKFNSKKKLVLNINETNFFLNFHSIDELIQNTDITCYIKQNNLDYEKIFKNIGCNLNPDCVIENFILLFNINFNKIVLLGNEFLNQILSSFIRFFDNFILFENVITLSDHIKEDILVSHIDFSNCNPQYLIDNKFDYNWNDLFKNKTFLYDDTFIHNNKSYFLSLNYKIFTNNFNVKTLCLDKVLSKNSIVFPEFISLKELVGRYDRDLLEKEHINFIIKNKFVLENEKVQDNLKMLLNGENAINLEYDNTSGNYYIKNYNLNDYKILSFTNKNIKLESKLNSDEFDIERFQYTEKYIHEYEGYLLNINAELTYGSWFFKELSEDDIKKMIDYDLYLANYNFLNDNCIKNVILKY